MHIHQVLLAYYRGGAAARCHLRTAGEQTSRWINVCYGSSLNGFTRVYRGVIVCSNNSLRVDALGRGALIKPGALRTFPFISSRLNSHLLRQKARRGSRRRPKSMPRCRRRRKAHGPRWVEIIRSYRGSKVEIAPWWMTMMPRASWKRAAFPSWRDGIINYCQANSSRHAWPRMNKRRARACTCVRVRVCVCRCTHDRIQISAITIGKSSEPFIASMSILILDRRHESPNAAQKKKGKKRAHCSFHPREKFMNKAHLHANTADTPDHSESFRHASRVTHFVPARVFFTFSPIESRYNGTTLLRNVTTLLEL